MLKFIVIPVLLISIVSFAIDVAFICDDTGGYSAFNTLPQLICDPMVEDFTYIMYDDNGNTGDLTSNPAFWANYDIVIWYASGNIGGGRLLTTAEYNAANEFIDNGGWLLLTGYDLLGSPNDALMADLVRSSVYGCYHYSPGLSYTIIDPDHFIVDGPYGSFTGALSITETFMDEMIPNTGLGCTAVISIDQTADYKVIDCAVNSGRVTSWNGNESSINWISDPDCANMLRNWIAEGLIVTAINRSTWGQIKASY